MRYLILYPGVGEKEEMELFGSAQMASSFIEEKLRYGNLKTEEIKLFELNEISFEVEHVPVVNIGQEKEEEEKDQEEPVFSLDNN